MELAAVVQEQQPLEPFLAASDAETADPAAPRPQHPLLMNPSRLRQEGLPDAERNYAMWMHIAVFAVMILPPTGAVTPIILWLIRREKSAFVNDHGLEIANMIITGAILSFALWFIPIAGWAALGVWYLIQAINVIRGCRAAGRSEYFRYPMTFRFLS